MKILTINEISSKNIGDQAIGIGLNVAIKEIFGPATEIYNFSVQKGQFIESITSSAATKVRSDSGNLDVSVIYHFIWTLRYIFRLLFAIPTFSKIDFAIVGGGSLIMNNKLQFPTALFLCGSLLRFLGKPYAVSGVSMSGEVDGVARHLFQRFLKGALHVDMRDPISINKAQDLFSINVHTGSDYAFALNEIQPIKQVVIKEFKILLNISASVKNMNSYLTLIRKIIGTNDCDRVALITTGDVGDIALTTSIANEFHLPASNIFHADSCYDFCRVAQKADVVIGSRLHAAILAIFSKSRTLIMDVGYKQKGFFMGLGLDKNIIDYTNNADILFLTDDSRRYDEFDCQNQKEICLENLRRIKSLTAN